MKNNKIILGITHGDYNGIGYEVIIKSLLDQRIFDKCIPVVYGSPLAAGYHRKALGIDNFSFNIINSIKDVNPKRANIINCVSEDIKVEFGKSSTAAGGASLKALNKAVIDLKDENIDVLITAPINKFNIQSDSFNFPGHTEYLMSEFREDEVLMLMVSEKLKVGVVTGHIPVSQVAAEISTELVLSKLYIFNKSLQADFGIRKPRIAVLGLNPHAGDEGLLGTEEQEIINPAIDTARTEGILAFGSYPADGFFGNHNYTKFDGVLAMYHDQGLTPFKTLDNEVGVNYSAGLPIVRTSPAHGTAFEIAGKNQANESSFRTALYMACDIFLNRKNYKMLNKNSLESVDVSDI